MNNKRIVDLNPIQFSAVTANDVLPIVNISTDETNKITIDQIKNYVNSGLTDEQTITLNLDTNKIELKEIVASATGGTRTFQGDFAISGGTLNLNTIGSGSPIINLGLDSSGEVVTGTTGDISYWSASTGTNAIVVKHSNSLASGDNSLAEGYKTTAIGTTEYISFPEPIIVYVSSGCTITSSDPNNSLPAVVFNGDVTAEVGEWYSGCPTYPVLTLSGGSPTTLTIDCSTINDLYYDSGTDSTYLVDSSINDYTKTNISGYVSISNGYVNGSAHAEGYYTIASGFTSHAEGFSTIANGFASHAEGQSTTANGAASHAEGFSTTASGNSSHAEGFSTTASGEASHAEGIGTIASGNYSHAEGSGTSASGDYSHAEGQSTIASGAASHTEGQSTIASGAVSHAEGRQTTANGEASHAEGFITTASGIASHAEGNTTIASGYTSHAEGSGTIAVKDFSHSGGINSIANGLASFIHSSGSTVNGDRSVVLGGSGITGSKSDTVYVPDFVIKKSASVPTTSGDTVGEIGSITWDNTNLYVKTSTGWGKIPLVYSW